MVTNNAALRPSDNPNVQAGESSQNTSLNMLNIVNSSDFRALNNSASTANQHLPQDLRIVDSPAGQTRGKNKPTAQDSPTEESSSTEQAPPTEQAASMEDEEKHGTTTVKKDDEGNVKEYESGDYTLSKHDDGKWYYHQNGEGHDFVEVNGDSIKMDDQGKVTYNESGMFGKDDQTLGDGSTGFMSSITSAASHARDAISNNPLDTFNTIAFAPVAALDAIAGTNVIEAIGEIEKGAVNEIIHNPGEILKDVAIGALIGAATVATGGGALVALGIGAAALATTEIVKNKGDLGGVINDASAFGSTVADWGSDIATVAGNGQHSQEDIAEAKQGLQQLGAFGAHIAAGTAGGIAGGVGAEAVGLQNAIPNAMRNSVSRFRADEISEVPTVPKSGPVKSTEKNPSQEDELDFSPPVSSDGRQLLRSEAAEPLENPGAFTLPNGKPIDANSMRLMREGGLTQDSYVYRVMDPKYLDLENNMVAGNPNSCALIAHPDTPRPTLTLPDGTQVQLRAPSINASEAGPGLNFATTNPANAYGDPGMVLIGIRLGDMLAANGQLFKDVSGISSAYYATFDGAVPFYYM